MRGDRKLLVLGVTLAGAIVGAMSVLVGDIRFTSFVDSQARSAQAIAITHKVAGATSVGDEMSIRK